MNTPDLVLQTLGLTASAVIFLRVEPVLNQMSANCRLLIRLAFWLLAVGSAALVVAITQGHCPGLPSILALVGMALLLTGERRLKGLLYYQKHTFL